LTPVVNTTMHQKCHTNVLLLMVYFGQKIDILCNFHKSIDSICICYGIYICYGKFYLKKRQKAYILIKIKHQKNRKKLNFCLILQ
jgi:hypothetical protein